MSQLGHSGNSKYMGIENGLKYHQGICGICAVLYAVYMDCRERRCELASTLGIDYLRRCFIQDEIHNLLTSYPELHKDIQTLTREFPGYTGFKITDYMSTLSTKKTSGDYSIALPPMAVVQYLKRWNIDATFHQPPSSPLPNRCILGLGFFSSGDSKPKLRHYVYKKGKKIFSYGEKYDDLEAFISVTDPDYKVLYSIEWNSQPVVDISK